MTLVDTSIWIDHLWGRSTPLPGLLEAEEVACHPLIRGEIACGTMKRRTIILHSLADLPEVSLATHDEVLAMIEAHALHGRGLGFIDLHLLASCRLSRIPLLTRDKRLTSAAKDLGVAAK